MDARKIKVSRLKRSGDFRRVREAGVSFAGRWLVFGVWKSEGQTGSSAGVSDSPTHGPDGNPVLNCEIQPPKFGVVTSRKVGGAVVRNKVRRRIRHIQQKHSAEVRAGVWCVTVARFRAAEATFAELDAEWCKLARRAGILCA